MGKRVVGLFWAVLYGLWWVLVLPFMGAVMLGWLAGVKFWRAVRRRQA